MRKENFLPSRDGFAFPNEFDQSAGSFGLGAPLRPSFGLSAGMAWLALDRFLEGRPVPSFVEPPAPSDPLFSELTLRQFNALAEATWGRLIEWQCRADRGLPWRAGLAGLSRSEWRRVQKSLDASVPVLLFLVLARGRYTNPSSNKAVLAVSYELDRRGRRASVLVYDPDRPGKDNIRLVFRTGRFDALDARLAIQTPVRGFFAVPYDRSLPAALSLLEPVDTGDAAIGSVLAVRRHSRLTEPLDILARSAGGSLAQLRRDRRGRWSVANLETESSEALRSVREPGAVAAPTRSCVLARGTTGDLLEFRRRPVLGWRSHSITNTPPISAAYRIDGGVAACSRHGGRISVVACREGTLLHFERNILGRWRVERAVTDATRTTTFKGTPALTELGRGTLHVVCRTEAGDLVHLRSNRKTGWAAENATIRAGGRTRFAVADDPLLLSDRTGNGLNVVTRTPDGDLLLFCWSERRGWRGVELSGAARAAGSDLPQALSPLSAAIDQDGTVHVVARDAQAGLIHAWCDCSGAVGGDEITRSRPSMGARARIDGVPVVATMGGELHVYARQQRDLLLFRWSPVRDWRCEHITQEQAATGIPGIADDPVCCCTDGAIHIAFTDAEACAYHLAAEVPGRQRARRRPAPFAVRFAVPRAVSLALPLGALTSAGSTVAARLRSAVAAVERIPPRMRALFQDVRSRAARPSRAATSGIGAQFVRAASSRTATAPRGTDRVPPAQAALRTRNPDAERNERELQRILALAEQEAPKVLQQ